MSDEKHVPVLVKLVAVLYYFISVYMILAGIFSLLLGGFLINLLQIPFLSNLGSTGGIIGGILIVGLGILGFSIGRGLWFGKPWARIAVLIVVGLVIISSIYEIIRGSISDSATSLVINILIGAYLLFNNKVKEAFK